MFSQIEGLLCCIYKDCKKLYVSRNTEYKSVSKDIQIKYLSFVIVIRGVGKDNIVYYGNCSSNGKKSELKAIIKDLKDILKEWSVIDA